MGKNTYIDLLIGIFGISLRISLWAGVTLGLSLRQDDDTVLKQLRYACTVVGFMQVVGHGVSAELQEPRVV